MMRVLVFTVIFCVVIAGCDRQVTTINAKEDIHKVEEFVVDFYKHIYVGETDSIIEILDPNFISEKNFQDVLGKVTKAHGTLLRIDIKSVYTERVELGYTTNFYSEANVKVSYENGIAEEELNIRLDDNVLRLAGYHSKYQ